jgi:hypothetical protein
LKENSTEARVSFIVDEICSYGFSSHFVGEYVAVAFIDASCVNDRLRVRKFKLPDCSGLGDYASFFTTFYIRTG